MADLLASDEPRRLADFLRENREEILAHWEAEVRKVRAGPAARPRIHALERLEVGYDLAEVVAEYAVLRRCITELAWRMHTPALRSAESR